MIGKNRSPTVPGCAPPTQSTRHPGQSGKIFLPRVLDTHAANLAVFAYHDTPALEQVNHRSYCFAAILRAGTDYGDQVTE